MNHALFFTLLSLKDSGDDFVLKEDFVIFDEAHTLAAVAAAGIGQSLSRYQLVSILHRLYNARTRKGLLARQTGGYKTLCSRTVREVNSFFESLRDAGRALLPSAQLPRSFSTHQVPVRRPAVVRDSLHDRLGELQERLQDLEETCEDFLLQQELAPTRIVLQEAMVLTESFLEQSDPSLTYWIEFGDRQRSHIAMRSSPADVAEALRGELFREKKPVIMTSATLAVGTDLRYFEEQIGSPGCRSLILDSPFDFMYQLRIVVARDMPAPESPEYLQEL
ncbi:MAG: hypothetical protein KAJ12_08740, partial [Bacteroidetes bacterium]|nr:hypothetical protein [Bacteroidota bacterium]